MKISKKVWIGCSVLVVLAAAGLLAGQGGTQAETVKAKPGVITQYVEDTGYVQAATSYDLYASQSGKVIYTTIETGQMIHRGQTLLVLENLDLNQQVELTASSLSQAESAVTSARAAVRKAELDLKDAEDNLKRNRVLRETGAISEADYEKSVLLYDSYQQVYAQESAGLKSNLALKAGYGQSLQQLKLKKQQLTVISPVDGQILYLPVKIGQYIIPGTLMASVGVPDLLEVKTDILSDDLAGIKIGQKVVVTSPVLGSRELSGTVKKIYPQAEEKQSALGIIQRRVPVIISLSDAAKLKPGFEVNTAIQTNQHKGVLILPREAVRTSAAGNKEVLLVKNGQVQHRSVITGLGDSDYIEIKSGVRDGDVVIKDASSDLADKTRIKPAAAN